MKQRKFFLLTAICVALTLVLGACGDDIKAEAEKNGLILSDDGKTVTGVKDKAMTDCIIPDGVTDIGDKAFADCTKLTSITIPNSVTSIGDGAFAGVQKVIVSQENPTFTVCRQGVLIDKKRKKILYAPRSLSDHYTIPDSVTSIGIWAFAFCDKLTSITIPNSVTSIGIGAFSGCEKLTSITIPNSVTSIGNGAFSVCTSLTNITIPNSVKSIGWGAFYGCEKLTGITVPDSVTSIGDEAFNDCEKLTGITIPSRFTDDDIRKWYLPKNCKIIRK